MQCGDASSWEAPVAVASAGALALSTAMARRIVVHPREEDAFRLVNELPAVLFVPVFGVMQAGSLAAVFVAAVAVQRTVGSRVAATTFAAGFLGWLGSKAVKRCVQRGRPSAHLPEVTMRGPEDRGLGFPSGHAAVVVGMATTITGCLPPPWGAVVWALTPVVTLGRLYVGAHLPLDIVGGAALGGLLGVGARIAARDVREAVERFTRLRTS